MTSNYFHCVSCASLYDTQVKTTVLFSGLTIDYVGRWLYWADAKLSKIEAIHIDDWKAKNRKVVWDFKNISGIGYHVKMLQNSINFTSLFITRCDTLIVKGKVDG